MNNSFLASLGHLSHNSSPTISTKVGISSEARYKDHCSMSSIFLLKVQAGLLECAEVFLTTSSWCS